MKTERELFQEWFKTIWLGIDLIQTIGEDYAFKFSGESYGEDVVNNHWQTWQAATQREGFKWVPVEPTEHMLLSGYECRAYGGCTKEIYKAMIGVCDD